MTLQEIVEACRDHGSITPICPTEPVYECQRCQDTGWITWTDDKGYRMAERCPCMDAKESREKLTASGISGSVERYTFGSWRTDTELQQDMLDKAKAYIDALCDTENHPFRPWMYAGGNPGAGKTHICTAVCGELLARNKGVKYMQWATEVPRLKSLAKQEDFEDEIGAYVNVSVLYIDDLLKQRYTENPQFTEADIRIAFAILNARYLQNKPTIISSEWDLRRDLLPADEGVFSRVYERCRGFLISIPRDRRNDYRLRRESNAV